MSTTSRPAPRIAGARPIAARTVPGLNISAPRRLGLLGVGMLAMLAVGSVAVTVPSGPVTAARGRIQAEPVSVRHDDGGTVVRVHVKDGDEVDADALLVTLDGRLIDNQIAGLKVQEQANRMRHGGLRQEYDALAAGDRPVAQRQRLQSVEAQMTEIDQELLGLQVRIAMADAERKRTEIRSPRKGRIVKLAVADGAALAALATVALIQPAADRLLLEAFWPIAPDRRIAVGQPVAVWLREAWPWSAPLMGRIEHISGEDAANRRVRTRVAVDWASADVTRAPTTPRDQDFELQLITGTPSLAAHLLFPVTSQRTLQP